MDAPYKTGDAVLIAFGSKQVRGSVKLASPNGRSLMLEFEAILGVYVGMMPVLQGEDDVYRDLINSEPLTIARVQ